MARSTNSKEKKTKRSRNAQSSNSYASKKVEQLDDDDYPELSPVDSADELEYNEVDDDVDAGEAGGDDDKEEDDREEKGEYEEEDDDEEEDEDDGEDEDEDEDEGDDENGVDEFEDQGSSDEEEDLLEKQEREAESDDDIAINYENIVRSWAASAGGRKGEKGAQGKSTSEWIHTDDWSSDDDDDEGKGNRIGRVPLHWYDEYEHIGYDAHGKKVAKSVSADGSGDRIDQAIANQENKAQGKFVVFDALNDKNIELSARQLEIIRRVQAGAFAHPEHDATPDYIDYFTGVDPEISGLTSDRYEPKARFQPSKWEKLQVERLLTKLKEGKVNMDYLTGKIRDMRDAKGKNDPNKPFMLWTGEEEEDLRNGLQRIAAPKLPPPGHGASYIPPDEYLPKEEELEAWKDMEPSSRPYGHMIPKKFPNLRSVGAYPHSVLEAFERCLDLYLCPRVVKRRLNIDPESLVPRLPQASDLKPFPTAKCIEYITPHPEGTSPPLIRSVSASPDGQYMASGATDGYLRLWEVETGRLLRSWDLSSLVRGSAGSNPDKENTEDQERAKGQENPETDVSVKPVVCVTWNPNKAHHCLLAAVGTCIVVVATGTAGQQHAEVTDALLTVASQGGQVTNPKARKAVEWQVVDTASAFPSKKDKLGKRQTQMPLSSADHRVGPICILRTNREVASVRWQVKGDYFVSVSPKAGAAAVLIHQLSKGNSQQPFGKAKGEVQLACFHPNKPFLFVASQQHVRTYHLVQQSMVKRLVSGCRWISCLDVHPSTGDHLIVGSLDRRVVWFDMDLGSTPYKTLKYHTRAIRACRYHGRYPLMATASDDGTVHVFHCMVYNDLLRNPLIVPVKILQGHAIAGRQKLGVLALDFHPLQPWLFTGGADGKIFLYQDI